MVKVMKKVSEDYVKNVKAARELFPGAVVMDVTIDGLMGKLDPGFRWGGVDVPGREGERGMSLKGVMEGLKLFTRKKADEKWWRDEKFLGKKRDCKSYGKLKGYDMGDVSVNEEKGKEIFELIYRKEIEKRFGNVLEGLRKEERVIVLLDYMEGDERKIINHADILKEIIENGEEKVLAA